MIKSELRKIFRERRIALSSEEHSRLSRSIVDRLVSEIDLSSIAALQCYISLQHFGEVETSILFDRVWDAHSNVITTAPRVDEASGEIESFIFQHDTPTRENKWKIPEPIGAEIVAPEALDLILVPLLCFDRNGHRVGYGKGFYDRYLQKCRPDCIKAGLSFFSPVDAIDDVHEQDIALDICITADETFSFT